MLTFRQFTEDKVNYSNKEYDKDGFPQVDRTFMQYSKASKETLKELAQKYKLDSRGSKKEVLRAILVKMHGEAKVQGYFNKRSDDQFQYVRKNEDGTLKPRSYEKVDNK